MGVWGSSLEAGGPAPPGEVLPVRQGAQTRLVVPVDLACVFRKCNLTLSRQQPLRSSDPLPQPPLEGKGVKGGEYLSNGNISLAAPPVPRSARSENQIMAPVLGPFPSPLQMSPPDQRARGTCFLISLPSWWFSPSLCISAESARASPRSWCLRGLALHPAAVSLAVSPGSI